MGVFVSIIREYALTGACKTRSTALCSLLLVTGLASSSSDAAIQQDRRATRITSQELQRLIRETPMDSAEHMVLISRAKVSTLTKMAYEEYTLLWKKDPKNAHTNLLRGVAAENHFDAQMRPVPNGGPQPSLRDGDLYEVTRSCLSRAVELAPDSPWANIQYGYFLYFRGSQMPEGLKRIKKGVSLALRDPRAHAMLGDVYANPTGIAYNPKRAEEELRTAIRLDSSYAYPLLKLASLHERRRRYNEAQRELETALSLTPPEMAQDPWIKGLQGRIEKGLAGSTARGKPLR